MQVARFYHNDRHSQAFGPSVCIKNNSFSFVAPLFKEDAQ